jgi:hypothetical protein
MRDTGEQRLSVCDYANTGTCAAMITENVPAGSKRLYTDAWQSYRGSHLFHATVRHGMHEWARDADGGGSREVHCTTCEGAGAALRTHLRTLQGCAQVVSASICRDLRGHSQHQASDTGIDPRHMLRYPISARQRYMRQFIRHYQGL